MAQSEEIRGLIRVADEIESVADYCERLANYRRRMLREQVALSDAALHELQGYLDRTIAFYEEIVDRARRNETDWLKAIETKAQYLATEADGLRDANLHRLATQRAAAGRGNLLQRPARRHAPHPQSLAEHGRGVPGTEVSAYVAPASVPAWPPTGRPGSRVIPLYNRAQNLSHDARVEHDPVDALARPPMKRS